MENPHTFEEEFPDVAGDDVFGDGGGARITADSTEKLSFGFVLKEISVVTLETVQIS